MKQFICFISNKLRALGCRKQNTKHLVRILFIRTAYFTHSNEAMRHYNCKRNPSPYANTHGLYMDIKRL